MAGLSCLLLVSFTFLLPCFECTNLPKLVLISLDGFRPDYLSPELTPFLYTLSKKSVIGTNMKPMFTTKTLPNHHSIATGLYQESHGMVANVIYDPKLGKIFCYNNTESIWWDNGFNLPIWIANEVLVPESSRHSGVVMWPGGSTPYSSHLPKYLHVESIWSQLSLKKRLDFALEWLSDPKSPANLVVAYNNQPDFKAHDFGPFSPVVKEEIRVIDQAIQHFYDQLDHLRILPETNIIILSDHGVDEVPYENLVVLSRVVDPSLYEVYGDPPLYGIVPKNDEVYGMLKEAGKKHHFKVYKKEDIPAEFHFKNNRRIQPIIVYAEEGYELVANETETARYEGKSVFAEHGYDNRAASMRPFFMAVGPAFKRNFNFEKEFENIDVYPLMGHVLNLPLSKMPSNGTLERIAEILKNY